KSIRKFIMFQMTTNLTAVGISVLCPIFGIDTPVTVLQMLWINLIMDTLGSLAFAGEAPSPDTMREKPKRRDAPIMNRYMVWRIALVGSYLLALCLWFVHNEGMREHFSFYETPVHFLGAFFALFVFADIANSVSARTTRVNPFFRLSHNRAFVLIFSGIIAVQMLIIYRGGGMFRTWPLALPDLGLILLLSSTVLIWNMLIKFILGRIFVGNTV
ncbi:MAG: cation transporting ATPase C-terminal domain-containing protein, partial [Eubacteriales bacterium]